MSGETDDPVAVMLKTLDSLLALIEEQSRLLGGFVALAEDGRLPSANLITITREQVIRTQVDAAFFRRRIAKQRRDQDVDDQSG